MLYRARTFQRRVSERSPLARWEAMNFLDRQLTALQRAHAMLQDRKQGTVKADSVYSR